MMTGGISSFAKKGNMATLIVVPASSTADHSAMTGGKRLQAGK
jgi:hypothetical protein